ncbi:hypothetical protein ACGFZQ_37965 [Streptomyces sp. NPDC048254]|uniref:hypothetical protein n=1 Tax=Streptomyces sp. NPDC048254 TaxID=3365525 RepID=UPI003720CC82
MGRVAGRTARVQVSARLTWTFSARAGLGHSRRTPPRASVVLLRTALRAAPPWETLSASVTLGAGRDWR